jgi:hypothetical protein
MKALYDKHIANVVLNGEIKTSSEIRNKPGVFTFSTLNIVLECLARAVRLKK